MCACVYVCADVLVRVKVGLDLDGWVDEWVHERGTCVRVGEDAASNHLPVYVLLIYKFASLRDVVKLMSSLVVPRVLVCWCTKLKASAESVHVQIKRTAFKFASCTSPLTTCF